MKFEELVKKLTPKLKGIAYKLNGRYTMLDHDDLFQEALLHLWSDFRNGKLSDKTDSYILQGSYYHLKNHLRGVEDNTFFFSLDEAIGEDGTTLAEKLPEPGNVEMETMDDKLTVEEIVDCDLTEREKSVITLYLDGLTVREVARQLGVSHVCVVKTVERIREKAKKLLYQV